MLEMSIISEFLDATVQDQKKATQMLKKYPNLLNAKYKFKETVLHFLCIENYIEGVKFLLEKGADHELGDDCGDTPLISAVITNRVEITKLLLQHYYFNTEQMLTQFPKRKGMSYILP